MSDAKQATPAAELERQICSATEPKNEREWWSHYEIARLRAALAAERERADALMRRLVAIEDEHVAYADDVGDALGQGEDEPLLTCARRVVAERDALRERLRELVDGLERTHWSSWQTTAHFWKQFEAARAALGEGK